MNNLEIKQETLENAIVLICAGRLDAKWSGHLNDHIDRLVREGHYHISLNMDGIDYISSAGIRSLVLQYKNLKSVNGHFHISSMSENVSQVLTMVGMAEMLTQKPTKGKVNEKEEAKLDRIEIGSFQLHISPIPQVKKSNITFYGNPELIKNSGFKKENARLIKSAENQFSIGLGAIGESFDECQNRFGEYIQLGKNIAYLPADGSQKPDYMVSSGQLIATLTELYGLHFEGNFSQLIRFEPSIAKATIGLSTLIEGIQKLTNFPRFGMVMIAESGGLIGTSLNASPVDGKKIFTYPEVKQTINFTTEPAHPKLLTLSVGYFSSKIDEMEATFVRPIQPNSKVSAHAHSAIFPYVPLKKTDINVNETIEYLFESSELIDILHLTNDTRDIVGLGESQFVQGFCWIVPIESSQVNTHE